MNLGEVKHQIMGLAFEEEATMQEYADLVNEAISRATQEICTTVRPILRSFVIEQIGGTEEYLRYDMEELTKEGERRVFSDFVGKVLYEAEQGYHPIMDYKTEKPSTLLLPTKYQGKITVWYQRIPAPVTAETDPKTELELEYEVQFLLPLLASYYVWLDDDERKATQYYNRYDDLKMAFAEQPKAVISGGMRW